MLRTLTALTALIAASAANAQTFPRTPEGTRVRVNVELQEDFSMNQALSLYLLETLPLLDAAAEAYPLDLLTLVESLLENPELILRRQIDKIKDRAVAECPVCERRRERYQRVAAIRGEVACRDRQRAQAIEAIRLGQQRNRPGA